MKLQEGEKVKFGYGFAWRNWDSYTTEVFVVPFNFIMRWLRAVYYDVIKPGKQLKREQDIAKQAYNEGYNASERNKIR